MGLDLGYVANVVRLRVSLVHAQCGNVPNHVGELGQVRHEYLEEEPSCQIQATEMKHISTYTRIGVKTDWCFDPNAPKVL